MSTIDAFVRGRDAGPTTTRRRWLGPTLAGIVLLTVGLVTLQPPASGLAYDPTSAEATGLRGVVDLLDELGVEVQVTDDLAVAAAADTVLVPPLGWTEEDVRGLARGGARVVAELPPVPEAVSEPLGVGGVGLVDRAVDCALLADVEALRSSVWPAHQRPAGVDVLDRCIVRGDLAWLHLVPVGDGELVSLASMAPLVNQRFLDSDAAVAVVRLLAPTGDETVAVLDEPPGTAPPTLFDLVDPRWFDAAWLSLAVLLVLALARGRRLGSPVREELPVRVPSGELARAVGDLRHRAGHDARAAQVLREATSDEARRRLGLARDATGDEIVDALRHRGTPVPAGVAAALTGPLPEDAAGLLATARALAELRASLSTPTAPTRPAPTEP